MWNRNSLQFGQGARLDFTRSLRMVSVVGLPGPLPARLQHSELFNRASHLPGAAQKDRI